MLPTVILEALAAGRPVLGTAVGGIPYLLGVDRRTAGGLAGRSPTPAALAAALPIARAEAAGLARRGPRPLPALLPPGRADPRG